MKGRMNRLETKRKNMNTIVLLSTAIVLTTGAAFAGGEACKANKKMSKMIKTDAKSIVETAVSSKQFPTLVAALKAADLVDTLSGKGPFTVFAPTEEAFQKLPKGTLEALLKPENKDKLKDILTYHVVPGNVESTAAVKLNNANAVNGKNIAFKVENGSLFLNTSKVVKTDIKCGNGVIHVIDTVLIPK